MVHFHFHYTSWRGKGKADLFEDIADNIFLSNKYSYNCKVLGKKSDI